MDETVAIYQEKSKKNGTTFNQTKRRTQRNGKFEGSN